MAEMNPADWTLLSVVTEGETVEIEGVDLWWREWRRLDIGTLDVPHPSYPSQRHTLRPYGIETGAGTLLFCAGELSNGVWCFHVPATGQPMRRFAGATVNERLSLAGLSELFDRAIGDRNERRARDLLTATGLVGEQAEDTVAAVLGER